MRITAGQVAVVTGGTSGIGFGLAGELVRRGVHVVIADVRDAALPAAVDALSSGPGEVIGVRTDVTVEADVHALADATVERFGRADLLCNNAGVVCELAPMWEQSIETWRWLTDVKVMGIVHGVRAFAPLLIAQGTGHVLNTASTGGLIPLPSMTPYNATMHAVVGLTETLNLELRSQSADLGATVLCPGLVATRLGSNSSALAPAGVNPTPGDPGADPSHGVALQPAEVAAAALEAVEAGRVHAIVGAGTEEATRSRVDSLLADLA
jgi:NAD(P)-dependent dehydrogenase (short-subunit alcohol dehydrogenase family)